MGSSTAAGDFTEAWDQYAPRVAAFARRHVAVGDVPDVLSETFLQAWRRWGEVPSPALAWLLGTSRNVINNHHRSEGRRAALVDRLARLDAAARPADDAGVMATERMAALESLSALPENQREALLLLSWDGLTSDEAAHVLGVRVGTLRVRAHRARAALEQSTRSACVAVHPPLLDTRGS